LIILGILFLVGDLGFIISIIPSWGGSDNGYGALYAAFIVVPIVFAFIISLILILSGIALLRNKLVPQDAVGVKPKRWWLGARPGMWIFLLASVIFAFVMAFIR